jgi:Tfp pilus assembly protein PilP
MKGKPGDWRRVALAVALCSICVTYGSQSTQAGTNEASKVEKTKAPAMTDFTYTSQRRDPFERSLAFGAKNRPGAETPKAGYELEELKLVGLMKAGSEKFAVMEDTQGKGLLFKRGQNLNSNLWVSEILEEKIILGQRLKGDVRMITLNIPRK